MAGKSITLSLPFYISKDNKQFMLGMNWYSVTHHAPKGQVKKLYHEMVGKALPEEEIVLSSPIRTHYEVYYKNQRSDASNIVAVIDKFLMDALQEHGVIDEDNVQHYVQSHWTVVEQDKEKPRIEVTISEFTDEEAERKR